MAAPERILITGCRGRLGRDLMHCLGEEYESVGVDSSDLDITDAGRVRAYFRMLKPQAVLHTAAFTDVDGSESLVEHAFAVNGQGTRNIAEACSEIGAWMLYYSTDYVFDGLKQIAYVETDQPNPKTVYGRSKLAGEEAAASVLNQLCVARISWMYGLTGSNFVKTMISQGKSQLESKSRGQAIPPIRVVDDRYGSPTWTQEVAAQTKVLLEKRVTGLVHAAAPGQLSRYQLACRIFEILEMPVAVAPCSSSEYPQPAPRPANSALDNARLRTAGQCVMRPAEEALEAFLLQHGQESMQ